MKAVNNFVYVTFLCAVFCFEWSTQDKKNVRIQAPFVLNFRQQAEGCGKENGVPPSYMTKILDKSLPNELSSLKFFFCIAFNTGYIDQDGHFNVDKLAAFEILDGTVEEYTNTIKECNKIVKGDKLETLDAASDCLHSAYRFTPVSPK